jgi:hypothetical protein
MDRWRWLAADRNGNGRTTSLLVLEASLYIAGTGGSAAAHGSTAHCHCTLVTGKSGCPLGPAVRPHA